jgi:hypothetical protein
LSSEAQAASISLVVHGALVAACAKLFNAFHAENIDEVLKRTGMFAAQRQAAASITTLTQAKAFYRDRMAERPQVERTFPAGWHKRRRAPDGTKT